MREPGSGSGDHAWPAVISNPSPQARKTITPPMPSTAGGVTRGREAEQTIVRDLLRRAQHQAGGGSSRDLVIREWCEQ
ncbi:MAG TPA: hypothetical protein VF070_06865 [Streptosporangiaceae bacterium]